MRVDVGRLFLIFVVGAVSAPLGAVPPAAPVGQRWQMRTSLTDEFDGSDLNRAKWIPRHPSWGGRNSRFEPANVSVRDGTLQLRSTLRSDAVDVKAATVTAACVSSHTPRCTPGYYEARIQASDLSMTTAFWFQGRFSEIDVIENLGRPTEPNQADVAQTMMMNTHYFAEGWSQDRKTPVQWRMPQPAREGFHVYGLWWRDPNSVWFYHDDTKVAEVRTGGAFTEPMTLFFDTEVFTWHGWPTRAGLLDPQRNTVRVDWVRAWRLVDAKEAPPQGGAASIPDSE